MQNTQAKTIDLTALEPEQRTYIKQCIADSEVLHAHFDPDELPHWRMFYQLGLAYIHYLSSPVFYEQARADRAGFEFLTLWQRLGGLAEHIENSKSDADELV